MTLKKLGLALCHRCREQCSFAYDPNDANTVYVATDDGVWVTTSIAACANASNACWNLFGTGLPNAPAIQLGIVHGSSSLLGVATCGRGVLQIPLVTAGIVQTTATATRYCCVKCPQTPG